MAQLVQGAPGVLGEQLSGAAVGQPRPAGVRTQVGVRQLEAGTAIGHEQRPAGPLADQAGSATRRFVPVAEPTKTITELIE